MILLALLMLALIYPLTVSSWTGWDLGIAVCLASAGLARFRSFVLPHPATLNDLGPSAITLIRLAAVLAASFAGGTGRVIARALGGRTRPGFIEVPITADCEARVGLELFMLTIAPDGFVVDVDRRRDLAVVFVIDVRRADLIRQEHRRRSERYVQPIFARA